MSTFKRAEICGIASCGLFVAALACAQPVAPDSATLSPQAAAAEYERGLQETTIRIAGRDQVMTLEEAERIRLTVETYLAEEKPDLEPGVFGPGEAFVDGQGNIRLGAWILESAYSEKPELHLTFRVLTNKHFIVRQIIYLALEDGQWKVTGEGRQTAHLRYRGRQSNNVPKAGSQSRAVVFPGSGGTMPSAKRLGLSVVCVFFLATAKVEGQIFDALSAIGKAKQYFDVGMFYGEIPDHFGSFNTCLSKGFGYDRCRSGPGRW